MAGEREPGTRRLGLPSRRREGEEHVEATFTVVQKREAEAVKAQQQLAAAASRDRIAGGSQSHVFAVRGGPLQSVYAGPASTARTGKAAEADRDNARGG